MKKTIISFLTLALAVSVVSCSKKYEYETVPGDPMEDAVVNMDPESIRRVNEQLEAQEQPLYDPLFGLIHEACRPDLPPEDAVDAKELDAALAAAGL